MFARAVLALVVAGLLAVAPAPASARTADRIVARDTLIEQVWPLDGDFVYHRSEYRKPLPKRGWMASFRGHLRPARGIPRGASAGDIGRDAKGRKVLTFAVARSSQDGVPTSVKWSIYDLARNRSRPLHGLPSDCLATWVSMWRHAMAYACKADPDPTVFLRQGKRTRRI